MGIKSLKDVADYVAKIEVLLGELRELNEGGYLNKVENLPLVSEIIETFFNKVEVEKHKEEVKKRKAKGVG